MRIQQLAVLAASMFVLLAPTCHGDYLGKNKYGVDIFSVNLDLPEKQRFVETSTYYKPYLLEVLN
jgi:N-acylethanolamine-hydrolysing acid amidase